jgi:hypothetical protein
MAAKKRPSKKPAVKARASKASVQSAAVAPSKLTWALAVTFMVLSIVFVAQAFYYYA